MSLQQSFSSQNFQTYHKNSSGYEIKHSKFLNPTQSSLLSKIQRDLNYQQEECQRIKSPLKSQRTTLNTLYNNGGSPSKAFNNYQYEKRKRVTSDHSSSNSLIKSKIQSKKYLGNDYNDDDVPLLSTPRSNYAFKSELEKSKQLILNTPSAKKDGNKLGQYPDIVIDQEIQPDFQPLEHPQQETLQHLSSEKLEKDQIQRNHKYEDLKYIESASTQQSLGSNNKLSYQQQQGDNLIVIENQQEEEMNDEAYEGRKHGGKKRNFNLLENKSCIQYGKLGQSTKSCLSSQSQNGDKVFFKQAFLCQSLGLSLGKLRENSQIKDKQEQQQQDEESEKEMLHYDDDEEVENVINAQKKLYFVGQSM